jgi:hypothetical protein
MRTSLALVGTTALVGALAACSSSSSPGSSTSTTTTTTAGTTHAGGAGGTTHAGGAGGTTHAGGAGGTTHAGGAGGTTHAGGAGGHGTAGAGGAGGAAAPSCADYCAAVTKNCTAALAQFPSEDDCKAVCADWDLGKASDTTGDTVGCHEYHATAAGTLGADPHCYHAGPSGGSECGEPCADFCGLAMKACTGNSAQWASEAACETDCKSWTTTGKFTSGATGNTYECRLYHLTVAATGGDNATMHCPHIVTASPVCK